MTGVRTVTGLLVFCFLLLLLPPINAQIASPPLFRIVQNGRYRYIDNTGKVIVQPQFVWESEFRDGYADVYVCGRMVSIDEKGNLLPHVQQAKLEARKVGDKFGFVDAAGELKVSAKYDEARWFSEGLAAVRVGKKWGYIDESGGTAIAFQFAEASEFKDGRASVAFGELRRTGGIQEIALNEDSHGLIDGRGRVTVKGLDRTGGISEGRLAAEKDDRWGYLGLDGTVVIPFAYEEAHSFTDGLAAVQKQGKRGYIDQSGEVVIPFMYEDADNFSEGLALVKKDGKSGYIDKKGDVVIPFQFDDAKKFQTGLAAVTRGDESGFIEKSGSFAFRLAFDYASAFRDSRDLSRFWTKDERFGYVDHFGRVVWESAEPETLEPMVFPPWLQEKREESCVGVAHDLRKKVANFPPGEYRGELY